MKRCLVVFALPERQWQWLVDLSDDATVADALAQARAQAPQADVPWETADVGIFGEICDRATRPADGDRVELYRPLRLDPKESRRARAAAARAAADRVSARPPTAAPKKAG